MPTATLAPTLPAPSSNAAPSAAPPRRATDDEILGIAPPRKNPPRPTQQLEFDFDAAAANDADGLRTAGVSPAPLPSSPASSDHNSKTPAGRRRYENQLESAPQDIRAARAASIPEPTHLRATFEANPELRSAWRDASAYRESFATPDAARQATALLADVNHMDALFFSHRPEDHTALARAIANLDPAAFASLAQAMQTIAADASANADGLRTAGLRPAPLTSAAANADQNQNRRQDAGATAANAHAQTAAATDSQLVLGGRSFSSDIKARAERDPALPQAVAEAALAQRQFSSPATESQLAFLHAANAAAVEGVVAAIEAQVERLLPESVAKNARTRVVGEIYRELDSSLRANPQFAAQLRDAFRSGSLDDAHQRAIVSLLTGRARQTLPGVAKRVLSEWTSTIMSAANERRTRQRTAERRIDIAGSSGAGNDGRRSMSPRDLDYARLSDADILNL